MSLRNKHIYEVMTQVRYSNVSIFIREYKMILNYIYGVNARNFGLNLMYYRGNHRVIYKNTLEVRSAK